MLLLRLCVIITLIVSSRFALAESTATPDELRMVTDQVMEHVGAGDIVGGLKLLKPFTIVPDAEYEAMVGQAKLQLPVMKARFGEQLGYEFLKADVIGQSLIRYTYIDKFARHATRWLFYCYKGKAGWVVDSFYLTTS